ncbi:hypothetical protein J8L73_18455 [Pseudoalteromonas sp. MMG006]|uniref:hypothetical protein n=1 Tax=Pseudoalteromonas sp. MMG006 TaxID=2822683 RepID=UPI001B36CFAE|nr:hypothetical protein [Pseudoalteromonas sp. MMG006]MBQ4801077.1 hypothetical protein [Pseudoalteromonas sp. MMG006]
MKFVPSSLSPIPEKGPLSEHYINLKFNLLKEHHSKIENLYKEEKSEYEKEALEEEARFGENQDGEPYCSDYWIYLRELEETHLRLHRYSMILATYAYVETSFDKLCFEIEERLNLPISYKDLKSDGLTRSECYIDKVTKVKVNMPSHIWEKITTLQKLRHCIIHCSGDLSKLREEQTEKPKKTTRNTALNTDGLGILDKDFLLVEEKYISQIFEDVREYLISISSRVYKDLASTPLN